MPNIDWRRLLGKSSPHGYPHTLLRTKQSASQAEFFDPALKQYGRAFRLGEPRLRDLAERTRWYAARQQVMEHLLGIVSTSSWQKSLVLRGSVLLKTWLGESAREPGDLDWVVLPSTLKMDDPRVDLYDMILKRVAKQPEWGDITMDAMGARLDDIWTYEKAPGRRLVFPWQTAEGLAGTVQLDFVFGEKIPSEPVPFTYQTREGQALELLAASPAQSLAWKLLWLHTDMYPQGKDLYDAVLLAEAFSLDAELLEATLNTMPHQEPFTLASIEAWDIDWLSFLSEYPNLGEDAKAWGAEKTWLERLAQALRPTFDQAENDDDG